LLYPPYSKFQKIIKVQARCSSLRFFKLKKNGNAYKFPSLS
jgi:hypothetical protein